MLDDVGDRLNPMLRIAHLTADIDGRSNSGTARVASELIHELSNQLDIFQTFVHFQKGGETIYELPRTNEIVIPLGSNWITKRRSFAFLKWVLFSRTSKEKYAFDVVHWHSSRLFPFFFLFPSKKTILTLHDVGPRILPNVNTLATRFYYWNARIFQSKIYRIIAVSQKAMKDMQLIGKFRISKLEYIYNGTNFGVLDSEPIPGVTLPENYIICVSRWQPHKNVEILVEAANEIRSILDSNRVNIVLVGKPVRQHDMPLRLISKYKLESQIIVFSDLTDQNIAHLYDHALFNFFPSIHEGFGLSVLEGMARGCVPMVHTNTSTCEIAGAAGLTVDMTNLSSVVQELTFALSNPRNLQHKKELAREIAANFTWKQASEKLRSIYEGGGSSAK